METTCSTISDLGNLPRGGEIWTGEHPYKEAKRQSITRWKAPGRKLHNLLGDKTIIVKRADKGTITVIMSREQKIKEGQIVLNDLDNCRPLEKQMADETAEKIKQLTTSMLTEGQIDEMTVKWLSQTSNPPRIPDFYTLTKIHKPTLVGRPHREFHALSTASYGR